MAAEFDCCECGRRIIAIAAAAPPELPLCAHCLTLPGWFRLPEVREQFDPDHDGREVWERELP
ncbi:hypothetical protein [Methylobacterium iners]|uniref:Uncharacterized protein n=1 Tax=Methylobacterium iners TaxID=418707 RepID=A0ABQ4RTA4_9HYPH|nr:hypothetical protein [Methylobacterium iners]GJD93388.1 hypothetical protein OCOJLMKI_0582 [Methylobacterium iners]